MSFPQPKHGECLYYSDGVCLITGARVKADDPACPRFTPKNVSYTYTHPYTPTLTYPFYPYMYPYMPYPYTLIPTYPFYSYTYPYTPYVYPWMYMYPWLPPIFSAAYWWPLLWWSTTWLWPWWFW